MPTPTHPARQAVDAFTRFTTTWTYIAIMAFAVMVAIIELISMGAASFALITVSVLSIGYVLNLVTAKLDTEGTP